TAVNDPPVANAQAVVTDEDTAKAITLAATDVEGSPLTYAIVSGPAHGTLSGAAPNVTYTPAANYNGADSFTFKANDGSLDSNVGTVTITVNAVNDAPVVNAGPDLNVTLPAPATLAGTAVDIDSALTITWSKSSGPGTVTFANSSSAATTATFSAAGTYMLTLVGSDGQYNISDTTTITVTGVVNKGLRFDGSTNRVTFGPAPGLNAATFTIETWFKREGTGTTVSTGTGGLVAIPLLTKGMAQADGSNVDANYFLGINGSTRVLAADFEDMATGLNHPVLGVTPICDNIWYHAAATYDATTWRLYLNGVLETTLVVGSFTPRSDSIQHAGLGAAFTATGTSCGGFQGILDEPRIWNIARSASAIQAGMTGPITSAAGLIGRWSMDEGSGTTIADSTGNGNTGTIQNGAVWI